MGDFLHCQFPIANSPSQRPDAVFIGGHGGHLKEIMTKVVSVLADDGCIVMNSVIAPKVTTDSQQLWNEACEALGLQQEAPVRIQLNDHHPITILKCRK
jgi:precorrin-6Y C5,15-methyltransferase (decarboxylating)